MTADAIIAAGRRAAETLMTSTCRIERVTNGAWDETVIDYVDVVDGIYTGPCRLKFGSARVSPRDSEGQLLAAQQLLLYLPVGGPADVQVNDRVTVTDGGPDPDLTGRMFRVSGLFSQTYATARRIPVESLT